MLINVTLGIKTTIIHPATQKHIDKYLSPAVKKLWPQERHAASFGSYCTASNIQGKTIDNVSRNLP
jgi:hypothetical protein